MRTRANGVAEVNEGKRNSAVSDRWGEKAVFSRSDISEKIRENTKVKHCTYGQ